jgi:multimeric flavodoxin WrbA
MKVVGLIGSPRGKKSTTRKLLERALEGAADAGAETEIIDITKYDIKYCISCEKCYSTGRCVLKDDFNEVFDSLLAADGIVLASPVYFNSVSAQMKTFIDRTADCRHCLLYEGKYGMSVSSTASSGGQRTVDYMNEYLSICGAQVVGGVHTRLVMIKENMDRALKESYAMGTDLVAAFNEKREYPEQDKERMEFVNTFKYAVQARKDTWTSEYDHFVKKGWIVDN